MRFGLNKDLGFSEKDRNENIRRIAEVIFLMSRAETLRVCLLLVRSQSSSQIPQPLY